MNCKKVASYRMLFKRLVISDIPIINENCSGKMKLIKSEKSSPVEVTRRAKKISEKFRLEAEKEAAELKAWNSNQNQYDMEYDFDEKLTQYDSNGDFDGCIPKNPNYFELDNDLETINNEIIQSNPLRRGPKRKVANFDLGTIVADLSDSD